MSYQVIQQVLAQALQSTTTLVVSHTFAHHLVSKCKKRNQKALFGGLFLCLSYREIEQNTALLIMLFDAFRLNDVVLVTKYPILNWVPYHQVLNLSEPDGCWRSMDNVFPVRMVGKIVFIPVDDIICIKGAANYVEIHTPDERLLHRDTMKNVADTLCGNRFHRAHRSVIVDLNHVRELTSELGRLTLLVLSNNDEIRIGQSYREGLFKRLGIS